MQTFITYFQAQFKFMKRHISVISTTKLTRFGFVIGMLHFSCFLFLINFQRYMHCIYVWIMIKQSNSLQTRFDTAHMYDRLCIRTHAYVFLFSVKKTRDWINASWPWRWPRAGTSYMEFIGPGFHNTSKRVGQWT